MRARAVAAADSDVPLQIFGLCMFVLDKTQKPALVEATLQTLLRFLNWIPLGYIFETPLIESLVYSFLRHVPPGGTRRAYTARPRARLRSRLAAAAVCRRSET